MKVRIISDIHEDINYSHPLKYNDDIFTIIAGDISGNPIKGCKWLKENIKNGIFIHGNHICYNYLGLTIQDLPNVYASMFPLNNNVSYLNNQYKIINDIVFIGSCLYTDYKYANTINANMKIAKKGLNDFNYGKCIEGNELISLQPYHYKKMFENSISFIENTLKTFKDNKCVVITHHGISEQCIPQEYKKSQINASFISNLEDFIKQFDNLKIWICGHSHIGFKTFNIGNCECIMNTYGYRYLNECLNFNKNYIKEI